MLIPLDDNISNIVAATPGLVCMPAPVRLTRPIPVSVTTPCAPISATSASTVVVAADTWSCGKVKLMSVAPASETFCTIMSTLTPASASERNSLAATPG